MLQQRRGNRRFWQCINQQRQLLLRSIIAIPLSLSATIAWADPPTDFPSQVEFPARPTSVAKASLSDATSSTSSMREAEYASIASEAEELERHYNLIKRVVKLITPTVVHIEARQEVAGRADRSIDEAGSGVVIEHDERLYVITNRHVIKGSSLALIKIKQADGVEIRPTQVWTDPETDIAILAVTSDTLLPAKLGDSRKLDIGDFVLAVGSPFGLSHSVTYGIVSAKGRRDLQLGDDGVRFQDFLQTDAAINPGNSGGPLLNLRGEVIGINTAIASSSGGSEGIGFAIPMNMVMVVAKQLIERGTVTRAYLGVRLDSSFTLEAARAAGLSRIEGAKVTGITPGSPAEASEIEIGDVITHFDGLRIEDDNHLINLVSLTPVNDEVEVLLLRSGKKMTIRVRVGDRSAIEPKQQ